MTLEELKELKAKQKRVEDLKKFNSSLTFEKLRFSIRLAKCLEKLKNGVQE